MQWSRLFLLALAISFSFLASATEINGIRATKTEIIICGHKQEKEIRLAELQPYQSTNDFPETPIVAVITGSDYFTAHVPRFDGPRDRLYSGFLALAAPAKATDKGASSSRTLKSLGSIHYVEDFGSAAKYAEPFPTAASKKGLQVQMVKDAIALGVKHAALNVDLEQWIDLTGNSNNPAWQLDGVTYHFNRGIVHGYDERIKELSGNGMTVTLILLCYQSGNPALDGIMLHPNYAKDAPHRLSAFNTMTPDGLRYFKACVEFLADRYSAPPYPHGRAVNFIVGNEVNSHWEWSNLGPATMETFADDYLRTVRVCATAVHKISATSRVYVSLEHHWNIRYAEPLHSFPARQFIDYFNRRAQAGGNFDWHLAFHPYPENLAEPRVWNDKTATLSDETKRITFKNIQMLPYYFQRPELRYHGQPRHIILSEQGFNSPKKPNGELYQAAGYCYAWYKISRIAGIDAFILHRHVDHRDEGGLNLGLWRRNEAARSPAEPGSKKPIYEVFRLADTPQWRAAFAFALPVIGIKDWSEINLQVTNSSRGK